MAGRRIRSQLSNGMNSSLFPHITKVEKWSCSLSTAAKTWRWSPKRSKCRSVEPSDAAKFGLCCFWNANDFWKEVQVFRVEKVCVCVCVRGLQ